MKKLLISISVLTAAIFALVSCEQTSYIYEPTNECLTFSSNGGSWLFTDEPVIEFDLVRGVINTDLTVQLNLGGDGLFSLETPAQVHFAPGESTATVRVGYDADQAEAGESYSFTVSFVNTVSPLPLECAVDGCRFSESTSSPESSFPLPLESTPMPRSQ